MEAARYRDKPNHANPQAHLAATRARVSIAGERVCAAASIMQLTGPVQTLSQYSDDAEKTQCGWDLGAPRPPYRVRFRGSGTQATTRHGMGSTYASAASCGGRGD